MTDQTRPRYRRPDYREIQAIVKELQEIVLREEDKMMCNRVNQDVLSGIFRKAKGMQIART